jgi:IS5 family transposase
MCGQLTFSTHVDSAFETHRKPTRRDVFLDEMDKVVLWSELCAVVEPFIRRRIRGGRRPIGLWRMLRIHFLQQ